MSDKKVRGLKRRAKNMVNRLVQETMTFPTDFYNGYWHLHLPVGQGFISSNQTPIGIKRLCMQTLLDRAEYLMRIKPPSNQCLRVVVAIDVTDLWASQIIVFLGDSHFNGFFDRNEEEQKWIPLSLERNLEREWNVSIPQDMSSLGIREEIIDEERELFEKEIWFIGEVE
ncbi:hypothetical protein J2Z40_003867 [Cytobacillus eiseniae]|uniref:DUF3916 domain-containing protein n=1 Tax=Cytobacillus eiseniae TaxID=762947 RepID=A0ABS4RK50_9BACI|nr:DUF3916 domain-containing protein [Cytobacillus eiseniae]MBP2243268.1 hypothetical protein [Cytobacillus eiseniae]